MTGLQAGQMLGPYRIIGQIGQGGMATVYRAYHAAMNRDVALKVLPRQLAESSEFSARFHQEALTIAGLEHPHILPVYDHGEADEVPYLVMRYLDAGTLKDRLGAGHMALREIDRLFSQLADALDYAHARGVIHRDLKPSNALLDRRGNLFLADFGIAKLLESDKHFTSTGALVGTPAYMSPEQAQGQKVDARTDIYSLGVILYEMVTGRVPYEAETPLAVILKHINEPLPLPSVVYPGISPAVERVILKALAKNPEDRFASMTDFLAAWKQALGEAETVRGPQVLAQSAAETVIGGPLGPGDAQASTVVGDEAPSGLPAEGRTALPGTVLTSPAKASGPTAPPVEMPARAARPMRKPKSKLFWVLGGVGLLMVLAALVVGLIMVRRFLIFRARVLAGSTPAAQVSTGEPSAWRSWGAWNWVATIVVDDDQVYSGDWHGLTVRERSGGNFVGHYTAADGLPGTYINDLLLHPDDYHIWAATNNGLAQRTEDELIVYDMSDGLDSPVVMAIESTPLGLLAGTAYSGQTGGGLNQLGGNGWQPFAAFPSGEGPGQLSWNVYVIRSWEDGELWVGTMHGLGHYDPDAGTWETYFVEDGLPDNEVIALLVDGPGQAWVATRGGVVRFVDSAFEPVPQMQGQGIEYADGMQRDERGWYWFATYDGIYRFNPDNADWTMFSNDELGVRYVTGIGQDDDGVLYFGSDQGLIVYDSDDTQLTDTFNTWQVPGLPQVWHGYERILPATDGSLWFVGRSVPETDRFDPGNETWSQPGDLPRDYVPLVVDVQANTWCLEYGEGLHRLGADRVVTSWTTANGLPSNEIYGLAVTPDGTAWVGTLGGLAQIENDQVVQVYDRTNGLSQNAVFLVFAASDGSVWVSTVDEEGYNPGLSRRSPDGQWAHYGGGKPFAAEWDGVSAIAEDTNGAIWVAANGDALFKFEQEQWSRYTLPDENNWFTALAFAPDGGLWVGTGDSGVYRWDSASGTGGTNWQQYGVKDGLIEAEIRAIYVDAQGVVWFATQAGATRYVP